MSHIPQDAARRLVDRLGAAAPHGGPDSDLYSRLESLSKAMESSGRIDEHEHPDAYGAILDAMRFVAAAPSAPAPAEVPIEEAPTLMKLIRAAWAGDRRIAEAYGTLLADRMDADDPGRGRYVRQMLEVLRGERPEVFVHAASSPAPSEVPMPEPVAYAVMAWGSVLRLVVRADVADEVASNRRQMDPAANVHTVPLYSAAYAAAREAAATAALRAELDLRRKSGSAVDRLHNLCEGIAESADGSEWSREEWERIDAENAELRAAVERVRVQAASWRRLYRRAINAANGLTNYVEDRPELRRIERELEAMERDARAEDARAELGGKA